MRIAYGARVSLLVGVLATAIATIVGVVVGLFAGYYGGWLDSILARIMDVVLSFPYVLFAIVLVSVFGSSLPLTILVIAFFSFAAIGRIVRGQALSQREKEYVEAAHSLGAGNLRIMFVDILPNLVAPVIVLATLLIPTAIIFEATLSFLGLGVVLPTPSWGNMLSDAEGVGFQAWWFYIFPMLFLLLTTLAFNLLGDAVRDALDPRTERIFAGRRKKEGGRMTRFLIRRIVLGIITLWVIITLVFILYYARPGVDPARELAGRAVTPALLANINKEYGFNLPVIVQYWNYLKRLVPWPGIFNLGTSNTNRLPVTTIIAQAVPIDISLAVGSAIIWMLLGISVGVLAARRPRSLWDRGATVFVLTGVSMPTFILGLLLLYVFYYLLTIHGIAIFPKPGSWTPFTQNPLEWAHDLILPWITLALITAATYSRLTRSSLLETLGEDYIRTARAKGLSERRVVYRHALRSSLTPIVTQFGIDLATVLGGAIITESIFGLPGLGLAVVQAIEVQNLPVVIGIVLVASFFVVAANIVVDALYAVLDPRVRVS